MKTEQLPAIELGYREGSSDKVYRAAIEEEDGGFVVNFAYGRRGSSLAAGTKTQEPVSMDEALAIYEKLVKSKLAKGYKPTGQAGAGIGMNLADQQRDTGLRAQLLTPINEEDAQEYLADHTWCAQEKYDGRRMLIRKAGGEIIAANKVGMSTGFPSILAAHLGQVPGNFVIDGECIGDRFYAFDLLENADGDWRHAPYRARLEELSAQFGGLVGNLFVAETVTGDRKRYLMERLRATRKEGVVFKSLRAIWAPGLAASEGSALKCKFWASCSCVVARVNARRSVEVALGGVNMGNVTIPINHDVPAPGQVVEVRYLYVNGVGGSLYQPVYLGRRDDVPVTDCTVERQRLKYKAGED